MSSIILGDKSISPTDKIIFKHIGKYKSLWTALFDSIRSEYADLAVEWRYYLDGKSWLMKCTRKSKTIFWLSLFEKSFRVTFYLNKNHEPILDASTLSGVLKKKFKEETSFGKIKPITIYVQNKKDLEQIKILIDVKQQLK